MWVDNYLEDDDTFNILKDKDVVNINFKKDVLLCSYWRKLAVENMLYWMSDRWTYDLNSETNKCLLHCFGNTGFQQNILNGITNQKDKLQIDW